jgi:hypothetical protein
VGVTRVAVGRTGVASDRVLGTGDCEAWRDGPLGQPTNAVTSLGMVAAGVWLAGRGRLVTPRLRWRPVGYGVLLVVAGLGSVAYHGIGGRASERFHDWALDGALLATAVGTVAAVRERPVATEPASTASGAERRATRILGLSATAAPIAYALGRTSGRTCRPTSRWQWHGLWHVLVGVAGAAWGERTQVLPHLDHAPPPASHADEMRP